MSPATSLKVKVNTALSKVGTTNGTAPEVSQDPLDALAHEYNVASQGESYFKARREKAKTDMMTSVLIPSTQGILDAALKDVKRTEQGGTTRLATSKHHVISVMLKNGATYLDDTALKNDLMRLLKPEQVNTLFAKHTKRREPSQSWVVTESGE